MQNTNTEQHTIDLAAEVCRIWCAALEVDSVDPDADLPDLGGRSIALLKMVTLIADELGAQVPLEVFLESANLRAVAGVVEKTLAEKTLA